MTRTLVLASLLAAFASPAHAQNRPVFDGVEVELPRSLAQPARVGATRGEYDIAGGRVVVEVVRSSDRLESVVRHWGQQGGGDVFGVGYDEDLELTTGSCFTGSTPRRRRCVVLADRIGGRVVLVRYPLLSHVMTNRILESASLRILRSAALTDRPAPPRPAPPDGAWEHARVEGVRFEAPSDAYAVRSGLGNIYRHRAGVIYVAARDALPPARILAQLQEGAEREGLTWVGVETPSPDVYVRQVSEGEAPFVGVRVVGDRLLAVTAFVEEGEEDAPGHRATRAQVARHILATASMEEDARNR